MKKLLNLKGAKPLSKTEQKFINGGTIDWAIKYCEDIVWSHPVNGCPPDYVEVQGGAKCCLLPILA